MMTWVDKEGDRYTVEATTFFSWVVVQGDMQEHITAAAPPLQTYIGWRLDDFKIEGAAKGWIVRPEKEA